MDDSLYDEFGNYIGPDIESDQDSDREVEDEDNASHGEHGGRPADGWITTTDDIDMDNQIVLAEDKKYYPTVGRGLWGRC